MIRIFLSYDQADQACATQMREGVEAAGYTVWREPDYPTPRDASYPYMIESGILGSGAVVVLWSQSAADSVWVKRHLLIAQRFFKPLVVVRLDETSLPTTLLAESLFGGESCSQLIAQLLPHLPAPDKADALLTLGELAASSTIRARKDAIDHAASMLQRGEQREAVLTILEYLERNDLMYGVREKAREVLAAATPQQPVSPQAQLQDARHLFGVRCKNGHLTTFDRRKVCSERKEIMRGLDELLLTCGTCGVEMAVDVDCEGYA